MDVAQLLLRSHAPNLRYRSVFIGAAIIAALVVATKRRLINRGDHLNPIIASFALLPFVVFNQQVITGYSLQPFHYELYIAPYSVAVAGVLITTTLLARRHLFGPSLRGRPALILWCIATLVVARATATTVITSSRNIVSEGVAAEKLAVVKRMHEKTVGEEDQAQVVRPTVFFTDLEQADMAPAIAPYLVLWSPHMFVFPGVTEIENKERLYRYLYFSGVTQTRLCFDGLR